MKHLKSNVIDYKDIFFDWLNGNIEVENGDKLEQWYINEISQNNNSEEII